MPKSILVTGASSGIGAATVETLAGQGHLVYGTIRKEEDRPRVEDVGGRPLLLDVTDKTTIETAREFLSRELPSTGLGALVNNAGIPCAGPLEYLSLDEIKATFDVNLFGVIRVTQALLPLLKQARGRIINISSVSGTIALPFMGAYAASKFALEALSDSLRREMVPFGIGVTVIQPGSTATAMWDKIEQIELAYLRGTRYEVIARRVRDGAIKAGRRGMPASDVARAVCKAVDAGKPLIRILVTKSPLLTRLTRVLPDRLLDSVIARRLWQQTSSAS